MFTGLFTDANEKGNDISGGGFSNVFSMPKYQVNYDTNHCDTLIPGLSDYILAICKICWRRSFHSFGWEKALTMNMTVATLKLVPWSMVQMDILSSIS